MDKEYAVFFNNICFEKYVEGHPDLNPASCIQYPVSSIQYPASLFHEINPFNPS